jgi:hypothetical protein
MGEAALSAVDHDLISSFCVNIILCWRFRRAGLLPDVQPAHEHSLPAGTTDSLCYGLAGLVYTTFTLTYEYEEN